MKALRMGHNRLLDSTGYEGSQGNDATWSRGALAVICVLVALGSLLCLGKESLAKQPPEVQGPSDQAASQRPTDHGQAGAANATDQSPVAQPEPATSSAASPPPDQRPGGHGPVGAANASHPKPATQPEPAQSRPVDQAAPARPAHGRPLDQGTPDGGRPAEPPGRGVSLSKKPTHEPSDSPEHVEGLGPQKPVKPDTVHPQQKPVGEKPVGGDPVLHPDHQQPTPRPTSGHEQGNESTGQPEDTASQGQHAGPATPPGPDTTNANTGPPQQKPMDEKPVSSDSVSHPDHQQPTPQLTSGHEQGSNASTGQPESAGSHGQHGGPATSPGPVTTHSGASSSPEPLQQKPVGGDPVSHPGHQQLTPHPTSGHEQGNESTGQPEGAGSQGQHGGLATSPGPDTTHSGGSSSPEPLQHTQRPPEYGGSAVPKPNPEEAGDQANTGNVPEGIDPEGNGQPANALDGRHPGIELNQPLDPHTYAQSQAGSVGGPGTRDEAEPALRPATTRDGVEPAYRPATARESAPGSSSLSFQSEGAHTFTVRSSDQQATRVSVPAMQPEGKQRPAALQARSSSETSLWSANDLLDPIWNNSNSMVQQAIEMFSSLRGGTRDLVAGNPYGKSLTQRWPPPKLPAPFSGVGPIIGGAGAGSTSSSDGTAPLLAVIVSCLLAITCRGLSRTYNPFLRPGTVPRLALERPG
jgi:hypothetical protein